MVDDRTRYLRVKRMIDLGVALVCLPILIPVVILCALALKIDSPGPMLHRQWRTGRHGERFQMLKFRTMVHNAEELKAALAHLNALPSPDFKIPNDPRITRVGRILRKTSLDELPQIVNVLRGEMSLVGPRPTSFGAETYQLWQTKRLELRPGITGLWQVTGRNTTTFDERLRLDIQYMRQMSLALDVRILLRTVAAVVRGSGA